LKITIVTDHRFQLFQDVIYSSGRYDNSYFERFKGSDNEITVVGLLDINPAPNRLGSKIVESDWLRFNLRIVDSRKKLWWIHKFILDKKQKTKLLDSDERLIILPSFNTVNLISILFKESYSVFLIGDPYLSVKNQKFPLALISHVFYFLSRRLIHYSRRTIYVTESYLQNKYPTKGQVISLSDVSLDFPLKNLKYLEKNKKIKIINVGNYDVKLKGHKILLKAFSKANKYVDLDLELIGGGSFNNLNSFIEKFAINNVVRLGYMSHSDLISYLLSNDVILISSSSTEGLSRIIIEALSTGCYVIASNVGGNSELVHSDYLYDYKDHMKLSQLIINAVNDLKIENPYFINEKFNLQHYTKDFLSRKWMEVFSNESK
jgi:glycosyltransferase involved in cell wall biosynthesis